MKDLLRFDTIVAACALLMSSITAGAMVYQTRVLQDQFSATVWPYLTVDAEFGATSLALRLVNQGVGPALIRSAQLSIDGKPVQGWDSGFFTTVFGALPGHKPMAAVRDASVDSSSAIRAGDQLLLLTVRVADGKVLLNAAKHRLALDFCYASINGKYWTLHYTPESLGSDQPVPVGHCTSNYTISAPFSPFVPRAR